MCVSDISCIVCTQSVVCNRGQIYSHNSLVQCTYMYIALRGQIMTINSYPSLCRKYMHILYSRKIWRGIKFGSFGSQYYNCQIKIRQIFLLAYIRMVIPYRTAKFKSANVLAIAILATTAKLNSCQYFWLYGKICCSNFVTANLHLCLYKTIAMNTVAIQTESQKF